MRQASFVLLILVLALCAMKAPAIDASTSDAARAGAPRISPKDGETTENFLAAVLRRDYPICERLNPWWNIFLEISRQADVSELFIRSGLNHDTTEFRFATLPSTTHYWRITPFDGKDGKRIERTDAAAQARFTTGKLLTLFAVSLMTTSTAPEKLATTTIDWGGRLERMEGLRDWRLQLAVLCASTVGLYWWLW